MKHVINVADERIQLRTRFGDDNPCDFCHTEIKKLYINGQLTRENRIDTEDDNDHVVSYHLECYDLVVFEEIDQTTIKKLYSLEVTPFLTRITSVIQVGHGQDTTGLHNDAGGNPQGDNDSKPI